MKQKFEVYLTCTAFPGKVRKSIVEAYHYNQAKRLALSLYPGYTIL
jgi:hypothetical protein